MIRSISIVNFALIDDIQADFGPNLNVVTGETGSGKSIVMGALSLVLGARADLSAVRDSNKKCVIEVSFEIPQKKLITVFDELEVDYDAETFLRREILPSGKSRAFINDTPVQLEKLRHLGSNLVDLHTQHQTSQLAEPQFHFNLLDAFSNSLDLRKDYQDSLAIFHQERKKHDELVHAQQAAKESFDYNSFQLEELKSLQLHENLQFELEEERNQLQHAEDIKQAIHSIILLAQNEESGLNDQLNQSRSALLKLASFGESFKELSTRLENLWFEWQDIEASISQLNDNVVVDPIRLEIVSDTLSTIYSLQQKHLVNDVSGLMDKERELTSICNIVLDGDESIQIQKKRLDIVEKKVWQCAKKLSKCRHDYSKKLADELTFRLAQLGMEHARFNFQLAPEETLGSMGTDALTLLFSANKGIDFGLLRKVASGGERSRIMLVVKSILAKNHHLPSMILDEIDAGVSGEMAKAMGSLMKEISKHTQLIAITHLPQIAAAGNTHLKVYKSTDETTTRTHIKSLEGEERVEEIAQMLDGNQITQLGRSHAKQLLN